MNLSHPSCQSFPGHVLQVPTILRYDKPLKFQANKMYVTPVNEFKDRYLVTLVD